MFTSSIASFFKTLSKFFLPDFRKQAIFVYKELHEQARDPWFYEKAGVPNTLDGRFEILVLHIFLWVLRMQKDVNYIPAYRPVTQHLFECMFDHLDSGMRESGVGDTGVPRRIKAMAEALYGRLDAYEAAMVSKEAMFETMQKNIYNGAGETADIMKLQLYAGHISDHLDRRPAERLADGMLKLPSIQSLMVG